MFRLAIFMGAIWVELSVIGLGVVLWATFFAKELPE